MGTTRYFKGTYEGKVTAGFVTIPIKLRRPADSRRGYILSANDPEENLRYLCIQPDKMTPRNTNLPTYKCKFSRKPIPTYLPSSLREYAGIERDIVFIGVSEGIEIWDRDAWEREKVLVDRKMKEFYEEE